MMYRVFVTDANNFEVRDYGLFDTKEEAERFKKIHVYELESLEQINIIPYKAKKVQESGFVVVSINTFVKSINNPENDPFIETEDRLWTLDNILEEGNEGYWEVGENSALIYHDGSAPAASFNILFPWPLSDLLVGNNYAVISSLKAKFFKVADAILQELIKEKPSGKNKRIELKIENFEEFKNTLK